MTSVHNNSISTASKYDPVIAYAQSISTALAIIIPLFLRYKTAFFRVMVILTVTVASIFSINGISIDEIDKCEDRLKTDPIYQQRFQTWDNLSKEFQSAQVTVDKYIELQMTSARSWNDGAKAARLRRDSLAVKKDVAYQNLIARQNELLEAGSKSNEAYIEFLSAAIPFVSDAMLINFSHILYALMPDLQMIVFAAILSFLFREWVSIPVPRSFGNRSGAFGNRSGISEFVQQLFGIRSANIEESGLHSSSQIRGVRSIVQIASEHPNKFTLEEIGIMAAQQIGRKLPNGELNPFAKSTVCEILKDNQHLINLKLKVKS